MKPIPTVMLGTLPKGSQFTIKDQDQNEIWEVTENKNNMEIEVMSLASRRVFDDFRIDMQVYVIPRNRRIKLADIQSGDKVEFHDSHYNISGKGTVQNITYPNGRPVYHLVNLTETPPGFRTTYVSPDDYVGDKIKRVTA